MLGLFSPDSVANAVKTEFFPELARTGGQAAVQIGIFFLPIPVATAAETEFYPMSQLQLELKL